MFVIYTRVNNRTTTALEMKERKMAATLQINSPPLSLP